MDPSHQLRAAVDGVLSNLSSNWGGLAQNVRREVGRAAAFAVPAALRRQEQLFNGGLTPALASLSLGNSGRGSGSGSGSGGKDGGSGASSGTGKGRGQAGSGGSGSVLSFGQPLFDLAMPKDEVKARLAPIPVYTVANPKNEFVLVAGESNTQLGFFFFRKEDAEAIIEKIREENPRLARDSKVLRVTMDNVYEVFTTPRDQTGLSGIHFRFMPDARQVKHALELYREAGVPGSSFVGVPVFQAEGLTVTTQDTQYVPLFLTKEDLDVAVQGAHRQRNAAAIGAARSEAAKHEEEYQEALGAASGAAAGRDKAAAEAKAAKARAALDAALERAAAAEAAPLPRVEVGSFEEVLTRMSASEGEELNAWSQVMFVAGGLLQSAAGSSGEVVTQVAASVSAAGKGGKK